MKKEHEKPEHEECDGCEKCKEVVPVCSRCFGRAFHLIYDTEEKILFCDCAHCGAKVVAFEAVPLRFEEEEKLEDMEVEGSC